MAQRPPTTPNPPPAAPVTPPRVSPEASERRSRDDASEPLRPAGGGNVPPEMPGADTSAAPGSAYAPFDELRAAAGNLTEVAAYAQQFVNAKISGVLYTLRKVILLAVLGIVTGLAGVSIVVTSAAMLVLGLGNGIGSFLPERWQWLGSVIVGFAGLAVSTVGAWLVVRRAAAAGREAAAQNYRESLLRQRQSFGTDALTRAAEHELETGKMTRTATEETKRDGTPPGVAGDKEELDH